MLNCPFCGSDKLKIESKSNGYLNKDTNKKHKFYTSSSDIAQSIYSVRCNKCHARGSTASSKVEAIDLWNTRY